VTHRAQEDSYDSQFIIKSIPKEVDEQLNERNVWGRAVGWDFYTL
jgi:hypothetical protein